MERIAAAVPRATPPRAARKSEWLRSALAHHHGADPGLDNEIVVLATGIDQYLQEVFHHLAYSNQNDTVSADDFTALCAVLGLTEAERGRTERTGGSGDGENDQEDEEFRGVCSDLPPHLCFKDFHSRLCGYFRVRNARRGTGEVWRLPVTEDTELVERQIRLRWPRVRRRKCVSFDLSRDQSGAASRSSKGRNAENSDSDEVAVLRELVEDLRSALQGSDARCLALEVALRRQKNNTISTSGLTPAVSSKTTTSITFIQGKLVPTHRIMGQCSSTAGNRQRRVTRIRDIKDPLLRELRLIRSSRDGQLEEAIRFNQRLEEELRWAYQEVRKLQGVESALRKENAHIRRRAEEAREALSMGLQRVRMIQEQAQSVPQLQCRITQLEAELHQYRSCCTCIFKPTLPQTCPVSEEETSSKTDVECLQRAVEGKAASDEEEDDREMSDVGQCSLLEVRKPYRCDKGCQNHGVQQLPSQNHTQDKNPISTFKDIRGHCSCKGQHPDLPMRSTDCKKKKMPEEETGKTSSEEKEKARLSLLEEKLTDTLSLLLQLCNKNMSRRALGKILMDTLDVCSKSGDEPSQVMQVADALCVQLASRDLLANRGDDEAGQSRDKLLGPTSGHQASSVNPLLISC